MQNFPTKKKLRRPSAYNHLRFGELIFSKVSISAKAILMCMLYMN